MSYIKDKMQQLANIVFNCSQDCFTKDQLLDSLIYQLECYNMNADEHNKVEIVDHRK